VDTKAQIAREWLRHPGARLAKQTLRRAYIKAGKEYDQAKNERELMFIQVKRQVLSQVIPELLDHMTYDPQAREDTKRFSWRRMLGMKR